MNHEADVDVTQRHALALRQLPAGAAVTRHRGVGTDGYGLTLFEALSHASKREEPVHGLSPGTSVSSFNAAPK